MQDFVKIFKPPGYTIRKEVVGNKDLVWPSKTGISILGKLDWLKILKVEITVVRFFNQFIRYLVRNEMSQGGHEPRTSILVRSFALFCKLMRDHVHWLSNF